VTRHRRNSEFQDLEHALRSNRPEPSDDFVRALSRDVARGPSLGRLAAPRLAFAAALTALVLAAFGAAGGFGYASKAASDQITAFANLSHGGSHRPADDQYRPGKGCGDKNHIHEREDECTGARQP
jgi:hypothetical protein